MISIGESGEAVLLVLFNIQVYSKKTYSWMSRLEIQRRLLKFHNTRISLSAIDYHLDNLSKNSFMKYFRKKCGRNPDGTIYRRPSNRSITPKGMLWLKKKGILIAQWLYDHLIGKCRIPRGKGPDANNNNNHIGERTAGPPGAFNKLFKSIGRTFLASW